MGAVIALVAACGGVLSQVNELEDSDRPKTRKR